MQSAAASNSSLRGSVKRRFKRSGFGLLSPALLVLLLIFFAPLALLLPTSLHPYIPGTGIGSNWQAARDANLRACGLRDFQLFCTGSAFEPKRPVLEAIGAHTFIDDRLRHLHDVQELIAHLVWIDLGDEQELDHSEISAHRYPSLATWFSCHRQELIELHQSNRQSRSE